MSPGAGPDIGSERVRTRELTVRGACWQGRQERGRGQIVRTWPCARMRRSSKSEKALAVGECTVATTGQTASQGALSQCWHTIGW